MKNNSSSVYNIKEPNNPTQESDYMTWDLYLEANDDDIYKNPNSLQIRSNIHSKQSDVLNDYYDMGFIASIADNLLVLSSPVKDLLHYSKQYANEKYQLDTETVKDNFEKNIKASKKLDKKVLYRSMIFSSISKVYPDFCCNMEKKVSTEKYSLYHKEKQAFKRVLNTSLLNPFDKLFSETLLSYKDKLSSVIDTPEFSKACCIEDEFVISEIDTFIQTLSNMPKEEQKPFHRKKIKIGNDYFSTLELAEKMKSERIRRLNKYSEIQKLYKKLENHPYIKLSVKDDFTK